MSVLLGSAAAAFVARTNRGESGRYKTLVNTHTAVLRVTVHPDPPSLKLENSSSVCESGQES